MKYKTFVVGFRKPSGEEFERETDDDWDDPTSLDDLDFWEDPDDFDDWED